MTTPYYRDESVTLHHGDCIDILTADPLGYDYRLGYGPPTFPDNSVDSVVTDPPYDLTSSKTGGFMGKDWDSTGVAFRPEVWIECLRVLKPGGMMLAFGGTRTWHRLACAIEDAGFEIRDSVAWINGSGFPKSRNVSADLTALPRCVCSAQVVNTQVASTPERLVRCEECGGVRGPIPAGLGTALKPAFEPIVVARKPLAGTVAANVLAFGTGALNVDGCRTDTHSAGPGTTPKSSVGGRRESMAGAMDRTDYDGSKGRWPANVVLDGSQADELDRQSGVLTSGANPTRRGSDNSRDTYGDFAGQKTCVAARGAESGGASRFFPTFRYEAKAPTLERPRVTPPPMLRLRADLTSEQVAAVQARLQAAGVQDV